MVFNEREAIRFRLEKIAEEKKVLYQRDRELDKEYNFYIQRLRELDQNGLGSSSNLTHGQYAEEPALQNHTEEPSADRMKKKYNGNLKQYDFDALKRGLSQFKKKQLPNPPEKQESTKFRLDPNDRRRRGKQYNLEEVAKLVETILREHGKPMEIHKLRDLLGEKGYKWKHFLPTLPNIMKHSDRIDKPYRGHVTYVGDESEQGSDPARVASEEVASGSEESFEQDVKEAVSETADHAVSGQEHE